jgi:hypothetical protein
MFSHVTFFALHRTHQLKGNLSKQAILVFFALIHVQFCVVCTIHLVYDLFSKLGNQHNNDIFFVVLRLSTLKLL